MATFSERLGFKKASGVGEAGWGQTLFAATVSFIYFLPVLMIIFTAIKPADQALSVPPTLSPISLFGLIPDQYVFAPTLENFGQVFNRVMTTGGQPEATGFDRFFFNSFFISSVSVLVALVIGTLAAYGFSRYPLKGNDTYLFHHPHHSHVARNRGHYSSDPDVPHRGPFRLVLRHHNALHRLQPRLHHLDDEELL